MIPSNCAPSAFCWVTFKPASSLSLKTQEIEPVGGRHGLRNEKLAIAGHRFIRHRVPLDRRIEAVGLLQHKSARRIGPTQTHLMVGGSYDPK